MVGLRNSDELTEREWDVADALASGLPNREIADLLSIGEPTVRKHISNILSKLHLRNRTEVALWAQAKRQEPKPPDVSERLMALLERLVETMEGKP